ncbi:MAG TPA: TonB-dependent receptor [Rariglobus sp.]
MKKTKRICRAWRIGSLAAGLVVADEVSAQTVPPVDTEVTKLNTFTVEDAVGEDSIVPTVRPISSVMGHDVSILDTPRGVSTITKGQLEDGNVHRVEDLSQFISGAFTAPVFGNAGVPTIRGDLGEAYQNGQRKAFNRNSFPISFNGVEAVDAVKGAPPAIYGYGNATGGYVNFVTKKPYFDRQRTTVSGSVGTWDSYRWQIDTGGPLSDKLAYRFSYEGSDADSFYRLVQNDSQSFYGALTYKPTDRLTIDFNAEYVRAHFTENPGTTRPTQDLIDHGYYITGSSVQNGGTGSFFNNTFTPTGVVKIDGSQVLLAPGDGADSTVWNAQLIANLELDGDSSVVNRTYFESVESEKHSSYYFYAWLPISYTAENRTEFIKSFDTGSLTHDIVTGVSLRYERRRSFVDIMNEAFDAFDVTMDPSTLVWPTNQLSSVQPVPGSNYYATPGGRYLLPNGTRSRGISATLDSEMESLGVFLQDQIHITSKWSVLLSARTDWLAVESTDPLPLAGYQAASDEIDAAMNSLGASLIYKPKPNTTLYLSVNSAAALEGSSSSGGFGLTGNQLSPLTFEAKSELIELGSKVSLFDGRLFLGAATYYQERSRQNVRSNLPDDIKVSGFELDAVYQPNRNFNAGANFSYMDARYVDGPLPGSVQTTPYFDPSLPSGNFGSYPQGDYRIPGLPRWLFNTYSTYQLDNGLGASVSLNVQGAQNLDLFGYVEIPVQFTLNNAIFYKRRNYELRLDFYNVTDEFNWRSSSTPFAGADLVTRELPFHMQFSFKYMF